MHLRKRVPIVIGVVALLFVIVTCLSAFARYPRFYVCITNNTNSVVHYRAEWCTRAGYNCTGYRLWSIAPGETLRHWGPRGNGRMDINMQTGGSGGIYINRELYGTTGGCRSSSSYDIRYNSRGFLRIY